MTVGTGIGNTRIPAVLLQKEQENTIRRSSFI
jgi:hypothetical protein